MIIIPNMHLGFNCKDLEKSIQWYETFLNCKEKFTIYYGDMIPDSEERRANMDKDRIKYLKSIRDVKWIVYMEFQDAPGHFVELFNTLDATEPRVPVEHRDLNYTHFAHVVDDVQAFYEEVLQKGGKDSVYLPPMPNIDRTFAFWLQDPDGNRMEFIQYTDMSMQKIGREMPGGLTLSEFFDQYTKK